MVLASFPSAGSATFPCAYLDCVRIMFGLFCISQGALGCLWCPGQSLGDGPIALNLIGFAMRLSEIAVHCSFRLLLPVCY